MAVTETDAANVHRSDGSRAHVPSNIGIRRRQLPSQARSATTGSQRLDANRQRPDLGRASLDRRTLLLERRSLHQADRGQIQSETGRQDLADPIRDGETERTTSRETTDSYHDGPSSSSYGTSVTEMSRDSSYDKSPLSILVNPEMDILPVAKTQQARASFDFCW